MSTLIDNTYHQSGNLLLFAIEEIKRSSSNAASLDTQMEKTSPLVKTSSLLSSRSGDYSY